MSVIPFSKYFQTDEIEIDDIEIYLQTSNMRRTLVDNTVVDHSDVFGTAPTVGAAPTTSSFPTKGGSPLKSKSLVIFLKVW